MCLLQLHASKKKQLKKKKQKRSFVNVCTNNFWFKYVNF